MTMLQRTVIMTLALGLACPVLATVDGEALQALIDDGAADQVVDRMEDRLEEETPSADIHYWLAQGQLAQIDRASIFRKMGLAGSARENLETALALDASHVPARVSLGQFFLQAPAIAGGSKEKALAEAESLMALNPAAAYRLRSDIAESEDDHEASVAYARKALAAGEWDWDAQYALVVQGVHYQVADAETMLDEAERNVRDHENDTSEHLPLLDYQRGKYAAVSGKALASGRAALNHYLAHEPGPDAPQLIWAEFRLAQVERQLGQNTAADARLAKLEAREVPENLGFALQDERRWHYAD